MASRIVLYGATGYMGGLTARAMVAPGPRAVLAGRNQGRLTALAEQLSRAGDGVKLETAVAGSEESGPLRELVGAGDVLVLTAGPFMDTNYATKVTVTQPGSGKAPASRDWGVTRLQP